MAEKYSPLIFIVEDDPYYLELIKYGLNKNEFLNLESFKNGKECLEHLNKNPEVILLDYKMDDMTGIEVLKKIKSYNANIQVILLSGQQNPEVSAQALKLGAYDYIQKNERATTNVVRAIRKAASATDEKWFKKGIIYILLFLLLGTFIGAIIFKYMKHG